MSKVNECKHIDSKRIKVESLLIHYDVKTAKVFIYYLFTHLYQVGFITIKDCLLCFTITANVIQGDTMGHKTNGL